MHFSISHPKFGMFPTYLIEEESGTNVHPRLPYNIKVTFCSPMLLFVIISALSFTFPQLRGESYLFYRHSVFPGYVMSTRGVGGRSIIGGGGVKVKSRGGGVEGGGEAKSPTSGGILKFYCFKGLLKEN